MISRIHIKRFKSIAEADLELGTVNVLIGANGSGKSNLLEAIGVLSAAAGGRVDEEALLRRGVRPGVPALYKCAFPSIKRSPVIGLSAADNAFNSYAVTLFNPIEQPSLIWRYNSEVLKGGRTKILGRSPASSEQGNTEAGLAALKAVEHPTDSPPFKMLSMLRDYCVFAPNTPVLRCIANDQQQRAPLGLSGGRLPEAVQESLPRFLRKDASPDERFTATVRRDALALIDWAKSYDSALTGTVPMAASVPAAQRVIRFTDRFMKANRNTLSGYDASEGALFVLFHAALAAHPKAPGFCAVDNADHALNPRMARELFRRICLWYTDSVVPRQIILTTHNPLALDGLPLGDDRIRLFAISRTEKGHTIARRVVLDEKLSAMVEKGWTLSRLWVMGHLGGVPNV